jgi:DNA-binding NtrC family response regulator
MQQIRILLVDDEVEFASALSERLQLRGYDAVPVFTAEEAFSVIRTNPPDVILLDLKMPGMNGEEVLKTIKKIDPTIEVIIVTGMIDIQNQLEEIKQRAFDYILKPIDIGELITKITKAKTKSSQE